MAELQKGQGHINGTQTRRAGRDPALHVLVKAVDDRLRLACGFDVESAQVCFTPSLIPVSYTHLDVYKRQGVI